MENKNLTAVEFLIKEILRRGPIGESTPTWLKELYEQAKEMEKEQIIDAYNDGCEERHNEPVNGAQYYNETYGSK